MYFTMGCSVQAAEINHRRDEYRKSVLQPDRKRSLGSRFWSSLNPFQACSSDADGIETFSKNNRAKRRTSLQDRTNRGRGAPAAFEPHFTEDIESLEALERESADTLTDLHTGVGGGSFPGSFLTPTSSGAFYSAASSPAVASSSLGTRQGPFRASLAYDQRMKTGSRSDFPRCANCGKEAQRAVEDLTQPQQPFGGITPGVPRALEASQKAASA